MFLPHWPLLDRSHVTHGGNNDSKTVALRNGSAPLLFEELLDLERCHAPGSGRSDRLAVAAIGDVSGCVHTGYAGVDVVAHLEVAVLIHLKLSLERRSVGDVSDAEKHCAGWEIPNLAVLDIAQLEAGDLFLADVENFIDDRVGHELDLGVVARAFEHDLAGPEGFAPVNDRDLGGEARQK